MHINTSCRPLKYICNGDGLVCDSNVVSEETNPRAFKSKLTDTLLTPYPMTVGLLKVCTTTDFRKAHRNMDPSGLECHEWHPKRFVVPDVEGKWHFLDGSNK